MIQGRLVCRVSAIPLLFVNAAVSTMNAQTRLAVAMSTSMISPVGVGSLVTWTGTATGAPSGNVWYRFRVRELEDMDAAVDVGARWAREERAAEAVQ